VNQALRGGGASAAVGAADDAMTGGASSDDSGEGAGVGAGADARGLVSRASSSNPTIPHEKFGPQWQLAHQLEERVHAFYSHHPEAVRKPTVEEQVKMVLEAYCGNLACVFPDVDRKYGTHWATEEEKEAKKRWVSANAEAIRQARQRQANNDEEEEEDRSIKLGLGDFVFYSVLVSVAGSEGLLTLASCLIVVLMGLGGTLVLLAVFTRPCPRCPFPSSAG